MLASLRKFSAKLSTKVVSPITTQLRTSSTLKDAKIDGFNSVRTPGSDKVSLMFTLGDSPGALQRALNLFSNHNINLSRLESKPCKTSQDYEFHVDFSGNVEDSHVQALLNELRTSSSQVHILGSTRVPWFPRFKRDLDVVANDVLDVELPADHPGFTDPEYRKRHEAIIKLAMDYRYGQKIPTVEYTKEEVECWGKIYTKLKELHLKYACAEHVRLIPLMEQNCGFDEKSIPQLQQVSDFLEQCTGFTVRPVGGLLSTRNFLYGLAFRTFFSTQYIRHPKNYLMSEYPDLVHETAHYLMLCDPDFAAFSETIGLASLGATDEQIEKLGRCYWFTVEFGLCRQQGEIKAYGAGILSSIGELQYSMGLAEKKPELKPFDPFVCARQTYPISTMQPLYFVADSFEDAKTKMIEFSQSLRKPFNVRYNPLTQSIDVDANVECEEHVFVKPSTGVYAKYNEA